jgi:hypothetical protein
MDLLKILILILKMQYYFQNNNNNNNKKNDDDYVYDIDFEKYVDKIVNSDDENDKKAKVNIIITEKEFYDKDHIYNSSLPDNNNTRIVYHKGNIYTDKNNLNRNYASRNYTSRNYTSRNYTSRNYANRNYANRNNNDETIVKKVSFNDKIKIIDDEPNTFRENSPTSIVNFNHCSDDVRNKKFNDFIPKGKYVFNKNNSNY